MLGAIGKMPCILIAIPTDVKGIGIGTAAPQYPKTQMVKVVGAIQGR